MLGNTVVTLFHLPSYCTLKFLIVEMPIDTSLSNKIRYERGEIAIATPFHFLYSLHQNFR